MDISFLVKEGRFNYRVSAVAVKEGKLLIMRDRRFPYAYLPGGRVKLHESAEEALRREMKEELGVSLTLARPLWLNQAFFTEEVSGEKYHEIGLYYLVDFGALPAGERFEREEAGEVHAFEWLDFRRLADEYLYPEFIKERIFRLPEHLELVSEYR